MTSTPVLVGAGDTLRHSGMESRQLSLALDNLSLGYALTYLIGLVSLIVGARYLPKLQHQDLQTSAQQIARERGLDTDANRKVYLPVIRAYRVGPELVAWTDGKNLRLLTYRPSGQYPSQTAYLTLRRSPAHCQPSPVLTLGNFSHREKKWKKSSVRLRPRRRK